MSSEERYGSVETRRAVLEATRALVAEKGSAVRIADVANRAGVSRQAIYLHFGDRAGLLVALVQHMDSVLNLGPSIEHVYAGTKGEDVIDRAMGVHEEFSRAIDGVARVLEAEQYDDADLGAAWRDRMRVRRGVHLEMARKIADLGDLDDGWTAQAAGDTFYAVTLPSVWRETTRELGWTSTDYVQRLSRLLRRGLLRSE